MTDKQIRQKMNALNNIIEETENVVKELENEHNTLGMEIEKMVEFRNKTIDEFTEISKMLFERKGVQDGRKDD